MVKRACYAADRTGRVILDSFFGEAVRRGIKVYAEFIVLDLIMREGRAAGVVAYELSTGELHVFLAKAVMLATGGHGKLFKTSSNCLANTGDGAAALYRTGLPLQDMEFAQFHPTGIYGLGVLISGAARVFSEKCVAGIEPDIERTAASIEGNLSPATFLAPAIGYGKAAGITHEAHRSGRTIREVALESGLATAEELDELFKNMPR